MWNRSCHRIVNLGQARVLLAAISQKIQSTHLIINMMIMMMTIIMMIIMMMMMIKSRRLFVQMMVMMDLGILVISIRCYARLMDQRKFDQADIRLGYSVLALMIILTISAHNDSYNDNDKDCDDHMEYQ